MGKAKAKPVLLGSLKIGDRFVKDGMEWEVRQQNWSRERRPEEGKAVCKMINTPVIINLSRDNYVMPV